MDLLQNSMDILFIAGAVLAAMVTLGLILARMYRRASKEVAFVRTGFGGQKVVVNGGALVFPVLHEIIPVNMNTLRLEVKRSGEQALITRDRMRVDVAVEFYVRVQPTLDAIANAAQTLGQRTMEPPALKDLVEGKFVDSLRAVAAQMAMEELHEQRAAFVQKVQAAVSEDLLKNGLELETVSLTGLDQTGIEYLNPQNAFDAEGLTRLTERIESRRKQRNEIEQDTQVAIQQKNLEAERLKLTIAREQEYARLAQEREVSIRKAEQAMEIAREQAAKQQEAKQAQISAKQKVDLTEIEAAQAVEQQRIENNRKIKEQQIAMERSVETAEIERRKTVEIAEQERAIVIAEKSRAQSEAQAQADQARALAVQAEEAVVTVREKEKAEREKTIELVKATEVAQRSAIQVTVAAETEKKAAEDKASALKTLAQAEAEKMRIEAEGAAAAEKLRAEAAARRFEVEAEGKRKLHEADNVLSTEQIAMHIRMALLKSLPDIIRESVKPLEQIDGIKIVQVEGLGAGASGHPRPGIGGEGAVATGPAGSGNLADQVVSSALRYRAQAPLLDSLMGELGLETGGDLNKLTSVLRNDLPGQVRPEGGRNTLRGEVPPSGA